MSATSRSDISFQHKQTGVSRKQTAFALALLLLAGTGLLIALLAQSWTAFASAENAPKGQASGSPECNPDWTVSSSSNSGTSDNALYGVAAVSSSDVWAVGYYNNSSSVYRTLIEHWDGTSWTQSPSYNASTGNNELRAVAARANNNVWAVGSYDNGTTYRTLIEHWDGTSWTQSPSDNAGTATNPNGLYAISAVPGGDIWAAGTYDNASGKERTLVERWNGTSWTVSTTPNASTDDNYFNGVTAISNTDVWAVGTQYDGSVYRTLAEHWNGTSWSVVATPNPSTTASYLDSIDALSSSDIWAVGGHYESTRYQTLVEHWNGTAWSVVNSLNVGTSDNYLDGVVALSDSDIWAVGFYRNGTVNQTLVEFWNGTSWIVVNSPNTGTTANSLSAAAAASASDVWAVGYHTNISNIDRTLIEQYNPCSTTCTLQFEDVPNPSTFYAYVQCLACKNIINGYHCGGTGEPCNGNHDPYFRANANVTRGQIAKIVALSAGLNSAVSGQTFEDVPPGSTFYTYTEQLYALGVMNGYTCGEVGEQCIPPNNRPYFRPNANATRAQLAKIDFNAVSYNDPPAGQTFEDVAPGSVFYTYTQHLTSRGIMSGYPCGSPEPCVPPANLPYFRPNADVTRGQTSKIVGNTFYPNCQTSGAR